VNYTSAFFLGSEGAIMKGSINSTLKVYAVKDNELYQQLSGNGFGYISTRGPANRPSRLRYFKSLIKQHPTSYFFIKSILNDTESYTKKELEELLALFQQEVQASRVGQDLGIYFTNRKDANAPYRNLVLADVSQEPHSILDPKAKLNLLTFWAS
jgi:hypothetical protein